MEQVTRGTLVGSEPPCNNKYTLLTPKPVLTACISIALCSLVIAFSIRVIIESLTYNSHWI
jgi:hypothetical protein